LPSQQATAKPNAGLTSSETSYTYTLFDFPGTLSSGPSGIVVSGKSKRVEVVGGYGGPLQGISTGSFLMRYTVGKTATTESYQNIAVPYAPQGAFQGADGVNKAGAIVGTYADASGNEHGWELIGTTFSTFDAPFQGAIATYASGINDPGEIAGSWYDSNNNGHGFTLISGTYTSVNYPGSDYTQVWAVNNKGDLGGDYADASDALHGMTDIGGVFASVDPPGSIYSSVVGLDDHGNAVGWFCTSDECTHDGVGSQGFLYSGGTFTIFNFPGSIATFVQGINNAGVLLGIYVDAAGNGHGFLATP